MPAFLLIWANATQAAGRECVFIVPFGESEVARLDSL